MQIKALATNVNSLRSQKIKKNTKTEILNHNMVFAGKKEEKNSIIKPLTIASLLISSLLPITSGFLKKVQADPVSAKAQEISPAAARHLSREEFISLIKNQLAKILLEGALKEEALIREFANKTELQDENQKLKLSSADQKELDEVIKELDKARQALDAKKITPESIIKLDINKPDKISVEAFENYTAGPANNKLYLFIGKLLQKEAGFEGDFSKAQPAVYELIEAFDKSGYEIFTKLYGPVSILETYCRELGGSKDDGGWDLKALSNYMQITGPEATTE